jgi:Nucleotide-sugar transporter
MTNKQRVGCLAWLWLWLVSPSLWPSPPQALGDQLYGLNGDSLVLYPLLEWPSQTPTFSSGTGKYLKNPFISSLSPIRTVLSNPPLLPLLRPHSVAYHSSTSRMSSSLLSFSMVLTSLHRLVTLAVQNAALSLLMHYSRVSMPPSRAYSAASAVLATELLKGLISLVIALIRVRPSSPQHNHNFALPPLSNRLASSPLNPKVFLERCRIVGKEVFRPDCWKLSIPAILYGQFCAHPVLMPRP